MQKLCLSPFGTLRLQVAYSELDSKSKQNTFDSHIHNECEIYINLSGDVSFVVENKVYPIVPGSIIITRPGEYHHCVYHSNALLGRAFAIKGDLNKSLYYFDEELKYYPYSAVASWLKLSVLRQAGADSQSIADENSRFEKLMKMRDMAPADISKLIRNQELDDAPLKNRKKL